MKLIDTHHSQLLARAMDTYTLRQRITAANIANIESPGYTRSEVSFEDELRRVQGTKGVRGMKDVTPRIEITDREVVLEDELLEMTDTQIRVNLAARSFRHHFDLLRNGITGINR